MHFSQHMRRAIPSCQIQQSPVPDADRPVQRDQGIANSRYDLHAALAIDSQLYMVIIHCMGWEVEFTPQAERWFMSLADRDAARLAAVVDRLERDGPGLARPFADSVRGSRHHNMKELRSVGGNLARCSRSILGACGACCWAAIRPTIARGWYGHNVPAADRLYDDHLRSLGGGGRQWQTQRTGVRSAARGAERSPGRELPAADGCRNQLTEACLDRGLSEDQLARAFAEMQVAARGGKQEDDVSLAPSPAASPPWAATSRCGRCSPTVPSRCCESTHRPTARATPAEPLQPRAFSLEPQSLEPSASSPGTWDLNPDRGGARRETRR